MRAGQAAGVGRPLAQGAQNRAADQALTAGSASMIPNVLASASQSTKSAWLIALELPLAV